MAKHRRTNKHIPLIDVIDVRACLEHYLVSLMEDASQAATYAKRRYVTSKDVYLARRLRGETITKRDTLDVMV